ncbi:hypothetical protein AOLI_G00049160 [Acnodon oligacanthus]
MNTVPTCCRAASLQLKPLPAEKTAVRSETLVSRYRVRTGSLEAAPQLRPCQYRVFTRRSVNLQPCECLRSSARTGWLWITEES